MYLNQERMDIKREEDMDMGSVLTDRN